MIMSLKLDAQAVCDALNWQLVNDEHFANMLLRRISVTEEEAQESVVICQVISGGEFDSSALGVINGLTDRVIGAEFEDGKVMGFRVLNGNS